MATINERIKQRRISLGLTLIDVAERIGVRDATVQRYESGEIKTLKHETVVALAKVLKCQPAYLMGWTDDIDEPKTTEEDEILQKYKALDDRGKHTVHTVLNVEYDRCTKPYLEVVAAHNEDYSEEQQRLVKEDLNDLEKLHARRNKPR